MPPPAAEHPASSFWSTFVQPLLSPTHLGSSDFSQKPSDPARSQQQPSLALPPRARTRSPSPSPSLAAPTEDVESLGRRQQTRRSASMPRYSTLDKKYEATGGFVYPGGGRAQSNKLTRQQIDGANLAERERLASPGAPKKQKESSKSSGGFFSSFFGGSSKRSIKSDSTSSPSSSRRPSLASYNTEPPLPLSRTAPLMTPSKSHPLELPTPPQLAQKTSIQPLSDEQMRDLLNRLSHSPNDLTEQDTFVLVDHYEEAGLCFPQNPEWIQNVSLLVETFYETSPHLKITSSTRKRTAEFLYEGIYGRVKADVDASRLLVGEVILPLLERTLGKETESEIDDKASAVLIDIAVSETLKMEEKDKALRSDQSAKSGEITVPVKHTGADPPSVERQDAQKDEVEGLFSSDEANAPVSYFSAVKTLLIKSATWTSATSNRQTLILSPSGPLALPISPVAAPTSALNDVPAFALGASLDGNLPQNIGSPMSPAQSILASMSPPTEEITRGRSSRPATGSQLMSSAVSQSPAVGPPTAESIRSAKACQALISIFTRLVLGPGSPCVDDSVRTLPSTRAVEIFNDLLDLLRPSSATPPTRNPSPTRMLVDGKDVVKPHASSPLARLAILQWMLHLRADTRHRVWVTDEIEASYPASLLNRSKAPDSPSRQAVSSFDGADLRRRQSRFVPSTNSEGSGDRESRGREGGRGSAGRERSAVRNTSRSRSRMRDYRGSRDVPEHPLWFSGQEMAFELPMDSSPSESLNTFDPQLVTHKDPSVLPSGLWLPVSAYIRVIIEILSDESEWDLVSYLLCHLPQQLANQHFFCGPRSRDQLSVLVDRMCTWLSPGGRMQISRQLPSKVKVTELNAVAYQTLDVLVSYHRQLSAIQHANLIKAFHHGVGATEAVGKVCIQALTMTIAELGQAIKKDLLSIMNKLSTISSSISLSIHILEFIFAVSQADELHTNFTQSDYLDTFAVALNIISTHHESVNVAPGPEAPLAEKSSFVLSQHMLQFAYFTIYPWFLSASLHLRPQLIPWIVKRLNEAKSNPTDEDDRAEVCIDFLRRNAYYNAEPMETVPLPGGEADDDVDAAYWIKDMGVVVSKIHKRSGWAKIGVSRASGATAKVVEYDEFAVKAVPIDIPSTGKPVVREQEETPQTPGSDVDLFTEGPLPMPVKWTREQLSDPDLIAQQFPIYQVSDSSPSPAIPILDKSGITTAKNLNKNNPVVDIHKIGVLYVGPGQTEPLQIFGNQQGSENYERFIKDLGKEVAVEDGVQKVPTGLNPTEHGPISYAWTSPLVVVAYHIATLMPQLPHQPAFNNKTSPIGNDYVRVIFNDSGGDYAFETIPTDFQYCNIVISPHTTGTSRTHDNPDEHNFFKVTVQRADGIPDFGPVGQFKILSAQSLPFFVRQLALMANILCKIFSEVIKNDENITSWRRRLFFLKRIQMSSSRALAAAAAPPPIDPSHP